MKITQPAFSPPYLLSHYSLCVCETLPHVKYCAPGKVATWLRSLRSVTNLTAMKPIALIIDLSYDACKKL
jgi:hypothetical protein